MTLRLLDDGRECMPEMKAMTEEQMAAVEEFLATTWAGAVKDGTMPRDWAGYGEEDRRLEAFKFLLARQWQGADAAAMFHNAVGLRNRYNYGTVLFPTFFPVNNYDMEKVAELCGESAVREKGLVDRVWTRGMLPAYLSAVTGHTKEGHPLVVERTGLIHPHHFIKGCKSVCPVGREAWEGVAELRAQVNELSRRLVYYNDHTIGVTLKRRVVGAVIVMDLKGLGMKHVNSELLDFLKHCFEIDQQHYPEGIHKMYAVNAPSMFPMVFSIVKRWLEPRVKDKVVILTEAETTPRLLEDIDPAFLPDFLGGTGAGMYPPQPQLDAQDHLSDDDADLTDHVDIAAGRKVVRALDLAKGDVAVWEYMVQQDHDVAVTAFFTPAGGAPEELQPAEKQRRGEGKHSATTAGRLEITFSNEKSWMRGKTVALRVFKT